MKLGAGEQRPARGAPLQTRQRLISAAAVELETHGYFATDSNRIARAAGYAPGTFYKHFADKRTIFLAVYDDWVAAEWNTIGAVVATGAPLDALAGELVDFVIAHHRRWRRFRATLRALVALDETVRRHHRRRRVEQLRLLERLRAARALPPRRDGAFILLQVERICDAIADGELRALGVPATEARAFLVAQLRQLIR
jgi:AcrR family transcriptional regulator